MKHHYRDIRDRLGQPAWWDEVGVPRYCDFGPNEVNDVYARQSVLMLIICQSCGLSFQVALSWGLADEAARRPTLVEAVEQNTIHYGDPPNVLCCSPGPTMNSIPKQVIEFWR